MAHRQRTSCDVGLNLRRQLEQSQDVRNSRPILSDGSRDVVLRQTKLCRETPVRLCFVDRVEVLALNVLDQCELQQGSILSGRDLANHDRNLEQAGLLCRTPASFSG